MPQVQASATNKNIEELREMFAVWKNHPITKILHNYLLFLLKQETNIIMSLYSMHLDADNKLLNLGAHSHRARFIDGLTKLSFDELIPIIEEQQRGKI